MRGWIWPRETGFGADSVRSGAIWWGVERVIRSAGGRGEVDEIEGCHGLGFLWEKVWDLWVRNGLGWTGCAIDPSRARIGKFPTLQEMTDMSAPLLSGAGFRGGHPTWRRL